MYWYLTGEAGFWGLPQMAMVGSVKGLATRMEEKAEYPVARVWCGLHQLDFKMQVSFEQALNESYLSKLTELIGFLRRQQNLIAEMQSTCPKVASTRWLSMFQVADWLYTNGFKVRECLAEKSAACAPTMVWWIFLYALREVAREVNAIFVSLQGLTTLVQQQNERFAGRVKTLLCLGDAVGPLNDSSIQALDCSEYEVIGSFVISHASAEKYVVNLDLWVCKSFKSLAREQQRTVVVAVARLYLLALSSIHTLSLSAEASPPVTPKGLVEITLVELSAMIDAQHNRVVRHFGEAGIDRISQEFKQLCRDYNAKKPIRQAVDEFDHRLAHFDDMWRLGDAAASYPTLASFCGSIASVFPNTATVESDFSVIGCEKTEKRTSLTDFALQGVLHCK